MCLEKDGITTGSEQPIIIHPTNYLFLECSSGNTALDFFSAVDNTYGIDFNDALSLPEENAMVVPQSQLVLPDATLQILKDQIDPLANSDNYGIEFYEQMVTFIEQALHLND